MDVYVGFTKLLLPFFDYFFSDIFARIDVVRAIDIVMESMIMLLVQINEDMHIHCLFVRKLCEFQAVNVNLDTSEWNVALEIHEIA